MKANHPVKAVFAAGLAATLLVGSALAAPVTAVPVNAETTTAIPQQSMQPIRVYGKASELGENQILLENSNRDDPYQKIFVTVSDQTILLNAVTGESKTYADLKENETLYAYVGPGVGKSAPPTAHATLILCGIPADFAVPAWAEVKSVTKGADGTLSVLMSDDMILHVNQNTKLMPYLTRNIVHMDDIKPGMRLLSWYSVTQLSFPAQATPTKIMVFPGAEKADQVITRQAFIDALYASVKDPQPAKAAPFSDVENSASVNWAFEHSITTGTADTKFMPNDVLTREQMMLFLLRYATVLEKGPVGSWAVLVSYQDRADLSDWAFDGAMWNQITKLVPPDAQNSIHPAAGVMQSEATAAIAGLLAR